MDKASQYLEQALITYKNGDFDRSERYCREVIKTNSSEPRAHYVLGLIAYARDDFRLAIEYAREANRLDPFEQKYKRLMSNARDRGKATSRREGNTERTIRLEDTTGDFRRIYNEQVEPARPAQQATESEATKSYLQRLGYLNTDSQDLSQYGDLGVGGKGSKNTGQISQESGIDLMDSETMMISTATVSEIMDERRDERTRKIHGAKQVTAKRSKGQEAAVKGFGSGRGGAGRQVGIVGQLAALVEKNDFFNAFEFFLKNLKELETADEINLFLSYILINSTNFSRRVADDIKPLKIKDKSLKNMVMRVITFLQEIDA